MQEKVENRKGYEVVILRLYSSRDGCGKQLPNHS